MLKEQTFLRIPGPTPIPPSVQQAMNRPMMGHRSSEASDLISSIQPRLRKVFGSTQDVIILTGSGTSALEAAVVNTVMPSDEVLVIVTGSFGDRFAKICEAHNVAAHRLDVEWGKSFQTEEVRSLLQKNPDIKAVFATYCETSTGVMNPIDSLSEAVNGVSEALIIVDGVSCVGAVETKMDDWKIDIMVTGSQKALMLPPGLAFIAASERAWKRIEDNPSRGFYLDLLKYRKDLQQSSTPFTPAISLLLGLDEALKLLETEGYPEVFDRHTLMKEMTRAAFRALEIPLLTSDADAAETVTSVQPDDFDADAFRKLVKSEFGLSMAGGQGHLFGKIFRIGHMGYCSPADMLQTIAMIEIGLLKIGKNIELGKGVSAAQNVYMSKEGAQ